jgi:hypothetical protein
MQAAELVLPLTVYTFFLLGMLVLLGAIRVVGRSRGLISGEYLRAGVGELPSDRIVDLHHHFRNQFEVPVLFYLGCILSLVLGSATHDTVRWAWLFLAFRLVHTAIVLINNRPGVRVFPFVISTVLVGLIWGELLSHSMRP